MATGTKQAGPRRSAEPPRPSPPVPPLQNGDRLTAAEFERRYHAMPDLKKAELIEGVVYMGSPVSEDRGAAHWALVGWTMLYGSATPGVVGSDNGTIRLDLDNRPQPDVQLRIDEAHGGQTRVSEDRYVEGAPELAAEIAVSSASYDLHDKLNAYRRNAVREYLVWRTQDRRIDWFALREGRFEPLPVGADGLIRSEVFPGLWLDPEALVEGNLARVVEVVRQGLASPEHAAFVERLAADAARLAERQGGPRP